MKIEELHEIWESDCAIDENHLDRASLSTAKLHSKYLRLLIQFKMKMAALQSEYSVLKQLKFRYYRGELSREELKDRQWNQWQGIKPLKNELDQFLQGDSDLVKLNVKVEYLKIMVEALESILNQIKARDWQIRNAITYKQFIAGN